MRRYNRFFSFAQMEKSGLSDLVEAIRGFVDTQNTPEAQWRVSCIWQDRDKNNENLYRALFFSPKNDDYRLLVDCEVLPNAKPFCQFTLIEKIDKGNSHTNYELL